MQHSSGFLKVVEAARPSVKEITIEDARRKLGLNPKAILIDVREDSEWEKQHAEQAKHLGRGVLERDIETDFPDKDQELILYCGGGFRSILAAESAQRMGYRNVFSLIGGYKELVKQSWPMKTS
jgi:rhodanese-related sulfurtransferase